MIYLSLKECPPFPSEQSKSSASLIKEMLELFGFDRNALEKDSKGRPTLPYTDADVSISHSSSICAAAVLTDKDSTEEFSLILPYNGARIGMDIEELPENADLERCRRIAERFLNAEITTPYEFYRLWTRKEAYGKMVGDGFFSKEGIECHLLTYTIKTDAKTYIMSISIK